MRTKFTPDGTPYIQRKTIKNWSTFIEGIEYYASNKTQHIIEFIDFECDVDLSLLKNSKAKSILIKYCRFKFLHSIEEGVFEKEILLLSNNIGSFTIGKNHSVKDELIFNANLKITGNVGNLNILGGTFKNIELYLHNNQSLHIGNINFSNLTINNTNTENGEIKLYLNNSIGETLILDGINLNGEKHSSLNEFYINGNCSIQHINISNFYVKDFMLDNLILANKTNISQIRPINQNSTFNLTHSDLSNCSFNNIDFSKFKFLCISDTTLINSTFTNVIWSKNITPYLKNLELIETLENYKWYTNLFNLKLRRKFDLNSYNQIKRETYRQLKHVMKQQNDGLNEIFFYRMELQSFNKSLKWSFKNIEQKLIISLSSIFNSYGQNAIKPMVYLAIGNIIFLNLLIYNNQIPNLESSFSLQGFNSGCSWFFKLINPFHDYDKFNGIGNLLDFFMKVWSAWMGYNIIRASRRFIK